MVGTYSVYKATYDGFAYYGITTNLKRRRLDHIRAYSFDGYTLHPSVNALSVKSKELGVSPSQWEYTIVQDGLTKHEALDLKAKLVRSDDASINILYKWTYPRTWYSYDAGEWRHRR